jgi:hypothetical protein
MISKLGSLDFSALSITAIFPSIEALLSIEFGTFTLESSLIS